MEIIKNLSDFFGTSGKKIVRAVFILMIFFTIFLVSEAICVGLLIIKGLDTVPIMVIIFMALLFGVLGLLTSSQGAKIIHTLLFVIFIFALVDVCSEVFFSVHRSWVISELNEWRNNARENYRAGTELERKLIDDVRSKEASLTKTGEQHIKNNDRRSALSTYQAILDSNQSLNFLIDSTKDVVNKKYAQKRKKIEVKEEIKNLEKNDSKVKKIADNEVLVTFGPSDTIYTGLVIRPGDRYYFKDPTAKFNVDGFSNPYYTISQTIGFEAKKQYEIVIYGCGYSGQVQVRLN